ncbi:MAG: 30S ribosomal protein S12 methylthiotransferase RimO [Bacillota bacterium]
MSTLAVVSLGCAKNLVDTEIMLGQLHQSGWELTEDFSKAEMILVNTCGFIQTAKEESINHILAMAEYKKPGVGRCRKLVVAGCLVQRHLSELVPEIPEVDNWIGLGEIGRISQLINQEQSGAFQGKPREEPFLNNENLPRYQVTLKHTAYVKIAEGCNHCCSYCAIPIIKGKFRSRSLESLLAEIKSLVERGVAEINLIAQDITKYGSDLNPRINLRILLEEIMDKANPPWIRLLYAYPSGIDHDLLQLMADNSSICKYLDLPLQHINSRILKLMNRPESSADIEEKIRMIRETVPGIALRTTFLVGFPSETEAEFEELLGFVEAGHFDHAGVFAYSREEGTRAYGIEPQIEEAVKEERRHKLLAAQKKVSARYLAGQIHQEQLILVDSILPDRTGVGRTQGLAPEVDGVVYLRNYQGPSGRFTKGLINGSDEYNLFAEEIF